MSVVKLLQPQTNEFEATVPRAAANLRVAVVSDATTGRNGVGTYYPDLVDYLEQHVARIELLAPATTPDRRIEAAHFPMPGDPTQRLAWPNRNFLRERLQQLAPNIIVIPSLGAFSYFAMAYARERKIPFVIVSHTNFDHLLKLYWPAWIARPARWALWRLNRWLCRQASGVAAMNAHALEEAVWAGSRLTRVMGTPLARSFLMQPQAMHQGEIKKLLFVGRLAEEKGIIRILEAASQLPTLEFTFVGDGPLRGCVEQASATKANVRYHGWLPREQIRQQLDAADMLLLPSHYETFGTVALEGLARQRCVLVSRECGIGQWPAFSECLFFTERDMTLATAITAVCQLDPVQRRLRTEAGRHVVTQFNRHAVHTWLKFLVDAVSQDRSAAPPLSEVA